MIAMLSSSAVTTFECSTTPLVDERLGIIASQWVGNSHNPLHRVLNTAHLARIDS